MDKNIKNEPPRPLTIILLFAAMAACAFGVYCGEAETVFRKAATICMECIGLG